MPRQTNLQVRRDTAANWTSTNPTLASGEIGFETDTLKFKIGDGSTAWTSLKYSQDYTLINGTATAATANTIALRDANASFSVNALTATRLNYGAGTTGAPTFTSYSAGVKEVLYDNISPSQAGYAVGIDAGVMWHGIPGADGGQFFKWYGGVTEVAKLSGTGVFTTSSVNATGDINTGGKLNVTSSAGDEGGEIFLANAVTNTSINAGVTIDVYQNKLRFWENGGTNRGYFLDISAGGTSVGTNIIGTASAISNTVTGTNSADLVYGNMADNDQFRIRVGGTATNAGFAEIATADDGTEPIYVRQYTGVFATLARTATILDGSGNTLFPGSVTAPSFTSNVTTGTAPFTVSSTTQVANLNAATASISVNISAGAAGSLPYQSSASITSFLARTATNNSTLAFNSSTNAPYWVQPTLSNTYYAATTSAQLAGVISDETGTGNLVFSTSPTIATPSITTSITTTSSTFSLINTTATTINFGGAATVMNIGSTSPGSYIDVGYDLVVSNNLVVDQQATFGGGYGATGVTISTAGAIDADGAITATGTVTGGNLTTGGSLTRTTLNGGGTTGASINNTGAFIRTSSSERYKQNIQNASYAYEDILALSPKTFRIREEAELDPDSRIYAGLIAEDVDQIESLRVFVNYQTQEDGSKIPDGIAYGEMVSALVSALKHQNSIIENLTSRVEALENN